jgi:hypothetical protein
VFLLEYISSRCLSKCTLHGEIQAAGVMKSDSDGLDNIISVLRHATVAALQFDPSTNRFRTTTQFCFASEADLRASSSFRTPFCRISGNVVVTQFTASTLSFIQMGAEIVSQTIPVKLNSVLRLAAISDIRIVSHSGGTTISLAVLGKSEAHAWVGRTSTIGSQAAAVRLITVDLARKSVSVNWSFDDLPTSSFEIIPLPKPRGGFIVSAPDFLTYCEEFSSSVTKSVNAVGGDASTVNYLKIGDDFEIDLSGAKSIALSDELVLFATQSGDLLGCHLVRQSGAFNTVSDVVWEKYDIPEKFVSVSNLTLVGDKLFVGSRQGNSFLYRLSKTEILLPMSVFASAAEEARLAALEQSFGAGQAKELLLNYQDEIHRAKISHSVEFGLIDELKGKGSIYSLIRDPESGSVLAATGSGDLVSLSSHIPSDLVFELGLKDMHYVFNFSFGSRHLLALAGQHKILLIDCGSGLRELGRVDVEQTVTGIVKQVTDDGHFLVITTTGLAKIRIITVKQEQPLGIEWSATWPAPSLRTCTCGEWILLQSDANTIWISRMDLKNGLVISDSSVQIQLPEGREIVCFSPSLVSENNQETLNVCITDTQGSLYIYAIGDECRPIFFSRHASVCKAVLPNELSSSDPPDEFILSITDVTKRPLEANSATSLFAEKVRITEASLVQLNGALLLVMLIDGRPVLIYTLIQAAGEAIKFVLETFDSVPILFEPRSVIGSPSYLHATQEGGLLVSVTPTQALYVVREDRGLLHAHMVNFGGFSDMSAFTSEYLDNGLVTLETSTQSSCQLRIVKLLQSDIDVHARFSQRTIGLGQDDDRRRFGIEMVSSVPGTAVATVTEEIDPGLVVPLPPVMGMEGEEGGIQSQVDDEFGAPIDTQQTASPSTVLLTCPVPPKRQKHQVWVFSGEKRETVSAIFDLQPGEIVTGMAWADSVLGLGPDVLIVGTTFALGEETPAQGRVIVVRIDYAPGVTAPAVALDAETNQVVAGGKILYDSLKRAAVTIVRAWKGCVAVGLGHRLMMYQWDGVAGRLRGVGMIDLGLQITSMTFFKNFIVAGDILRGVYLLRYKEDPVMDAHMNVISMAASIQMLAKSYPFQEFCAVKVETLRNAGSVGIVSLDAFGNLDLELFSPVNFGQYLRHSVPFNIPSKALAVTPVHTSVHDKALLIGSANGSLAHLIPATESEHHLASSLVGLMVSLLPQPGGVNPKLHHVGVGRDHLPNSLQAIESVDCLTDFLYLATPLQAEIANRLKQPIDVLMRMVARWLMPLI